MPGVPLLVTDISSLSINSDNDIEFFWARWCSESFLRVNSFCTNNHSTNNNNHATRYVLLLFPLYICGNWGIEKLRNIPKVTQLGNGRTGIQVFALKGPHSSVVWGRRHYPAFLVGAGGSQSMPRSTQPFSSWDIPEFSQRTGKTWERGGCHLVVREGDWEPGPLLHVYIPQGQPHILVFQVLKVLTHQS